LFFNYLPGSGKLAGVLGPFWCQFQSQVHPRRRRPWHLPQPG